MLLLADKSSGKAETAALLASFYLLCKPLAPLRLGGALILTPSVNNFIETRPALVAAAATAGRIFDGTIGSVARAIQQSTGGQREQLKAELLDLASQADGGIAPLSEESQLRLEEIVTTLLPELNPTADPARSELFTAEWECVWTTETELNFAREKGLFGLPWVRTYQSIDMSEGTLLNVLDFEDGELSVGSTISTDDADGARFNFAFENCSLRWRQFKVPLPPVGKGWGELLYLDDELRIQRDVRGDLLVATRVG